MGSFLGDFDVRQLGMTENVELLSDMGYYDTQYKLIVIMRAGLMSDLDSIPTIIKSVVRASPKRSWRGYMLHDALYRKGWDKKTSDEVLDNALTVLNIDWYARKKVATGLYLFGKPTLDIDLIENATHYVEIHDFSVYQEINLKWECKNYLKR